MKFLATALLTLSAASLAYADEDTRTCPDGRTIPTSRSCDDSRPFSNWGIGPAVTYDAFNRAEVSNVTVDSGGFVRGEAQSNADVGLVFELHYIVQRNNLIPLQSEQASSGLCGGASLCGSGPFIAVQAGGNESIIESLGGGWMWGFRRNGDSKRVWGASQFNIGVGVMVDPNNEVLDDGFRLNEPLPLGETQVRTHNDAQANFILLFSVSP